MKSFVFLVLFATIASSVLSGACRVNRSSPLYKQCDSAWGSKTLGSSSTICKVGCLMSSVASGMAGAGKTINGARATPDTLNTFLRANGGYSGNLFIWGAVSRFGLAYEGQSSVGANIRSAICANKIVILNVNNGGHWVLATAYDDASSTYTVNDSGYSRTTYKYSEVSLAGIFRV